MPYQQQETNSQAGVWRVPSSVRKTNSFNFKVFCPLCEKILHDGLSRRPTALVTLL